jgi:organic radical activating enzyme
MTDQKILLEKIEIALTEHCNLSCTACNHASPHYATKDTQYDTIVKDLTALSKVLHAELLVVAGGEPLLHPQLNAILEFARKLGIADRIELISNGVLVHKMDPETLNDITNFSVSVYPGVRYRYDKAELEKLAAQKGVSIQFNEINYFNLSILNDENKSDALTKTVFKYCNTTRVAKCYLVHGGYLYRCTAAAFIQERVAQAGKHMDGGVRDGVDVHGSQDLAHAITSYLDSDRYLESCRYCLGNLGKARPSTQLRKSDLATELAEDHTSPFKLLDKKRLIWAMVKSVIKPTKPYTMAKSGD